MMFRHVMIERRNYFFESGKISAVVQDYIALQRSGAAQLSCNFETAHIRAGCRGDFRENIIRRRRRFLS